MDNNVLGNRLMRAALDAERQAGVEATLKYKGQPFKGTQKADMRVRATVVAVLETLAAELSVLDVKKDLLRQLAAEVRKP